MSSGKVSVGHPVDVASGSVYSTQEDISISGKVLLTWERRYSTTLVDRPYSALGTGWTTRYFMTLTKEDKRFRFCNGDGDIEYIEDPNDSVESGGIARNLSTCLELRKTGYRYAITHWDIESGEIERYIFREITPGVETVLACIENESGQALDMEYDYHGRLIAIKQRLEKRRILLLYSSIDKIEEIRFDLANNTYRTLVKYSYDTGGHLTSATDTRGFIDRYEYDEAHRLTREILKDGGVFFFTYNDKGQCVKTSGLDRYDEKTMKYLDHIGYTEVTDSYGFTTRYQRMPSGQVVSVASPVGGITETEYDDNARIIKEIDANKGTISYEFDEFGNRSKITDQLGNEWKITFNTHHQPTKLVTPNQGIWTREYDDNNRLIATVNPLGAKWILAYDNNGNLISSTDPNGALFKQSFHSQGILQDITDTLGHKTRYAFDEFGKLIEKTGPLQDVTRFEYDLLDNPIRITFPDGSDIKGEYDAGGNLTKFIDGEGRVTRYRYASCKRLAEKTDPNGNTVKYLWGTEPSYLDRVINEKGEVYSFERNGVGKVTKEIGFDNRETSYEYDFGGRCIATTNGLKERILFERNALGNLVQEKLPSGKSTSYDYDPLGNLVAAVTMECKVGFERDLLGRITKEIQNEDWVETEYNLVSDILKTKTSKNFEATYTHDTNGSMIGLTTNGNHSLTFQRNAYGEETARLLPGNRARLDKGYDNVGQLVEQRLHVLPKEVSFALTLTGDYSKSTNTSIAIERNYRYDKAGSLLTINDGFWGKTEYVYDPALRLIKAIRSQGENEHFAYDPNGNMSSAISGENELHNEYAPGNQLIRSGDTKYEYDGNGRRIKKTENASSDSPKVWLFSWDEKDQLHSVTRPNGEIWTYTYDALGRRIAKMSTDKTEQFLWYGNVVIHHTVNKEEPVTWLFEQSSFRPLAKIVNNKFYSVINDHLGTPREMVDEAGNIVWSVLQKSWGHIDKTRKNEVDCQIRFQGQWFDDESGFCYNRFRYYDGEVGQFLCKDPIGLSGGMNAFLYSWNPIDWVDLLGLEKTYITYLGTDKTTGKPYVGYASAPGKLTGEQVLSRRYSGNLDRFSDRPVILYEGDKKAIARGLEQRNFEKLGGLEGTANLQNPVSDRNPNRKDYLDAADEHLADEKKGGC